MSRFRLMLASLPLWLLVLWFVYGFAKSVFANKPSTEATIVLVIAIVVGVAGYFLVRRRFGIKPASRNRDIRSMLTVPFQRFPNDVRIGVVRKGWSAPAELLSEERLRAFIDEVVWPRLSADLFVCSGCGQRRGEFVATMSDAGSFQQVLCTSCATQATSSANQ